MKTILWKELRENARWAPLGALAILGVLIYQWRNPEVVFDGHNSLLTLFAMVAPTLAFVLGLLQSWGDQQPAAKALLLHRGITASAAFGGKVLAGVLLYVAAVGTPLLLMALFLALRSLATKAAAPSDLLPAAFVSLCGFCCWPAAFLLMERPAKYIGSRLLPPVAAAIALFACSTLYGELLWLACAIGLVSVFGFLLAAWSIFVSPRRQAEGFARGALAVIVTLALLSGWMFVGGWVDNSYRQRAYSRSQVAHRSWALEFGPEGGAWLTQQQYQWGMQDTKPIQTAVLKQGQSARARLEPTPEAWNAITKYDVAPYDGQHLVMHGGVRFHTIHSAQVRLGDDYANRYWVFDSANDQILVYRQSMMMNRPLLESRIHPPTETGSFGGLFRFNRNHWNSDLIMISTTGVFAIPVSGDPPDVLYAADNHQPILTSYSANVPYASANGEKPENIDLALRLADRIILMDSGGKPVSTVAKEDLLLTKVRLPNEMASAKILSIARHPDQDNHFLGLAVAGRTREREIEWMHFDASGKILGQETFAEDMRPVSVYDGEVMTLFIPPGPLALGMLVASSQEDSRTALHSFLSDAADEPGRLGAIIAGFFVSPALGLIIGWWTVRRRGLAAGAARLWMGWSFLFGPPGALAVLAIFPRVHFEKCISCQQSTRADSLHCSHCQRPLDELDRTGFEIFESEANLTTTNPEPASSNI